jgi:outer membrane immunogenic protein
MNSIVCQPVCTAAALLSASLLGLSAGILPSAAQPRSSQPYSTPYYVPAPQPAYAGGKRWDGTQRRADPTQRYGRSPLWEGLYLGAHLGGGAGTIAFRDISGGTIDTAGIAGGLHAGYNWQYDSLVLGLEMDGSWTGIDGDRNLTGGLHIRGGHDWLSTARGRVGYAFGSALLYGTGGFAMSNVTAHYRQPGLAASADDFRTGYVVGGGVEMKLTQSLSGRVEALFYDFGNERMDFGAGGSTRIDTDVTTVRAGLTWHFN